MRINTFLARGTGLSRRNADLAVSAGRVHVNGHPAAVGQTIQPNDAVTLDNRIVKPLAAHVTIMLNKPADYVVSRLGQGSKTIYDLLPDEYRSLKPVGRLDKDSSGLLLLTDDGGLANRLTHPRYSKDKVYSVELDKPLPAADIRRLEQGVQLQDGLSRLRINQHNGDHCVVTMREGRNRQIRRTFAALGYTVIKLHRTQFGEYDLTNLNPGDYVSITTSMER